MRKWFSLGVCVLTVCNAAVNAEPQTQNVQHVAHAAANQRIKLLNYPALPTDIGSRVTAGKTKPNKTQKVDSSLAQDWALVNIGIFKLFNPLMQPIDTRTKRCSSDLIVAVIDTGLDYTHPELRDSLWINSGEAGPWKGSDAVGLNVCKDKSCNGIDDDGNGFVDDVVGWDFVNEIPLPYDTHGHGTHISGIISSASSNGIGTSGVCSGVSIMTLKYYDNSGIGYNNLQNTVRAIQYAVKMGAHIINYSGGGSDPAPSERAAVDEALRKGILFVAAAGNDGRSNERIPYYPASYGLENIIGVASVNEREQLLPSSNFGRTVHLAAPGLSVFSTLPAGRFGTMSGTSQATAFVTGAAALVASQGITGPFDFRRIKRWLSESARPLKGNESKAILSAGLLSVDQAIKMQRSEVAPEIAVKP